MLFVQRHLPLQIMVGTVCHISRECFKKSCELKQKPAFSPPKKVSGRGNFSFWPRERLSRAAKLLVSRHRNFLFLDPETFCLKPLKQIVSAARNTFLADKEPPSSPPLTYCHNPNRFQCFVVTLKSVAYYWDNKKR